MMYEDWSKSFAIFAKYEAGGSDVSYSEDVLYTGGLHPDSMSKEDVDFLVSMYWMWNDTYECWMRYV